MSSHSRVLTLAATVVWVAVGLPVLIQGAKDQWRVEVWSVAYLAFFVAMLAWPRLLNVRLQRTAMIVEGAAVVTIVLVLCNGFEGALLVIVAAQLALTTTRRLALPWIAVQSGLLFGAIWFHWSLRPALMLAPPYLGFEIFTFYAFDLLRRERASAARLAELQEQLAEQSRLAERLRVSQELHDIVGHHLTAMTLNLEVAAHQTEGAARDNIRTAQSLARLVLGDVREIAAAGRELPPLDLRGALEELTAGIPHPIVHLELAERLDEVDAERAHAILRCTQEIVTNAIRHADARNLWIALRWRDGGLEMQARDDGRGVPAFSDGGGLSGMRRRLAALGGTLEVATSEGHGFALTALLPSGAT